MENNLNDIEWIERYLDRSLSATERKEMEKRLTEEPDLKSKYQEYHQLVDGVRYAHLKHKLEQLRVLERGLPDVTPEARQDKQAWIGIPVKYLAIAASLAIVVVSYVLFTRPEDPAKLYAKYFEPYPNVFEPTVRGSESTDPRTTAFSAYDQGDYDRAARLFNDLLKEKQEPGILLLLGCANLVLNRTEEAQNNFLTLIKDFDEFDGQAKWFLALSYLKQGQREKAQLILEELGSPEVTYSKKANELLKEVK